jgi:hypothetical protein
MWDWSTAASLATALGTLVLALATFVAVRAANRAARTAEYSMQIGIRPLLMRLEDTVQKIMWGDEHWARLSGAGAVAEIADDNLYLAMSVRNAGSGVAVIHGWHLVLQELHQDHPHAEPDSSAGSFGIYMSPVTMSGSGRARSANAMMPSMPSCATP